jgi:predicted nucleic acid-binding protein
MIILDTNIVSEFFARRQTEQVLEWMNRQALAELHLTSIVLAELYYGARFVLDEARRQSLLVSVNQIREAYSARTLAFDTMASDRYGTISARRQRTGHSMETKDAMIAAICLVHGATLATRNVRDFDGLDLKLVNPFEA